MSDDQLSTVFAALADPTRRAILGRLATSEATVNVIAEPFAMSVQAVSKHLKVLEQAGLISRGREAQWRPCRMEVAPLERAADWIEANRAVWHGRLDRLEQHLKHLTKVQLPSDQQQEDIP